MHFDPEMAVGHITPQGYEIISTPQWHGNEWRALANVGGALAVVSLRFTILGKAEALVEAK